MISAETWSSVHAELHQQMCEGGGLLGPWKWLSRLQQSWSALCGVSQMMSEHSALALRNTCRVSEDAQQEDGLCHVHAASGPHREPEGHS